MMQGGMAAGQQLLGNAQARNNGQQTGLLGGHGAIDGTAQSFYNLGDPLNLTGKASSGHFFSNLLDPGNVLGFNQAANPNGQSDPNAQFPNLGAASLIPKMPAGGFVPLHNGNGPYNNMASMGAGGQTFAPQFAAAHPTNPNGPVHPAMAGNKPMQVPGIGGSPVNTGNTAMTYAMKNLPKDIGNRRT